MIASSPSAALRQARHGSLPTLDFSLPPELEAGLPPEARGLRRDQVRLMVSYRSQAAVKHSQFDRLPGFLREGDVLVINTSKTLNAAVNVQRLDGKEYELHLSTRLDKERWVIEIRRPTDRGTLPFYDATAGEELSLTGGGRAKLLATYPQGSPRKRLWEARLSLPLPPRHYLERFGFPIRYKYVHAGWPLDYYQNVYAQEAGSAEMPSAGRAFTPELITRLVAQGVQFAPLVLHTGVASLEHDEPPYPEAYRVPATTARLVNLAREAGSRVIAVGTTAIRALHTVTGPDGCVHPGEGWTDLVITPDTALPAIDGLLTGLHEPRSTHLSMLFAVAGQETITRAYQQALQERYLWHEFGDLHLILP